jgi:thiol-disulfide isomerase/thioredoxin
MFRNLLFLISVGFLVSALDTDVKAQARTVRPTRTATPQPNATRPSTRSEFSIELKLTGVKDGQVLVSYLTASQDTFRVAGKDLFIPAMLSKLDTLIFRNGYAKMRGRVDVPQPFRITFPESKGQRSFDVFVENSPILVEGDIDRFSISGSRIHSEYLQYKATNQGLWAKMRQITAFTQQSLADQDSLEIKKLGIEMQKVLRELRNVSKQYVAQHPDSFLSAYLFFKDLAETLTLDELKATILQFTPRIRQTLYLTSIQKKVDAHIGSWVGMSPPDFKKVTLLGDTLSLKSLIGKKYILLDFWASWCSPCRQESPELVAVYEAFKDKGLEVIAIADDRNEEEWYSAIRIDSLPFIHINRYEKAKDFDITNYYNISSYPTKVLINLEGKIVARFGEGDEKDALRIYLDQLLK